jgi:hypothetical protein
MKFINIRIMKKGSMIMNNYDVKLIAGSVLVMGAMLIGGSTQAAVLIEWQDGSAGHSFADWAIEAYHSGDSVSGDITGDQPAGPLHLDPNTGIGVYRDVVFTTDSSLTGDLSGLGVAGAPVSLQFNFYANADGSGAGAPAGLGFYFQNTDNSVWYYDIQGGYIDDGNNTFSVQLDYDTDAYGSTTWRGYADNTQATSLAASDFDITAIQRVGVWIAYNTSNSTQDHQIGLYGLSVPEPETYLILGMALLSVAIVFRKRISESLAEARAMMQV